MGYAPGKDAREVPISVLGGLCTEQPDNTLPDGVSPDNQDVVYTPGNVSSRPGLQRVITGGFPAGGPFGLVPTVTYAKTYIDPTGIIRNLYLDSNGNLWVENLDTAPGVLVLLTSLPFGSYAKSCTAFGREYIAVNDTVHGSDMPLQYDGENLDRVTQDAPGGPPVVTSFSLPSVALAGAGGSPTVLGIAGIYPSDSNGSYFTVLNVYLTSGFGSIPAGSQVQITGSPSPTPFDGVYSVINASGPGLATVVSAYNPIGTSPWTPSGGQTATITVLGSGSTSLVRTDNVVTATTATAHNLQVGYQVQIAGVAASVVGTSINSIVINNENAPGLATITTASAHGLVPGCFVTLGAIDPVTVGISVTSVKFSASSGIATITTSGANNLTPGATIQLLDSSTLVSGASVISVIDNATFTIAWFGSSTFPAIDTVQICWPVPNTGTPFYYEVVAAPTALSFQVAIAYPDCTFGSGAVYFAWNGTFYVASIPTSTTFTYQQYGPNATAAYASGQTATPYGQAAPGVHQCQVLFLTRQGAITAPSPPVQFVANGGQYLSVSNIPIGPANVVARILAFTGAQGAYFFYIPTTPQVNGQIVGTATQINDNSTGAVVVDFSDNTLFSALGINTPGNNLPNQIVLDGALGFGLYGSRLITWGQRNRVQNLLNLGFDGGYFPSDPTVPTGWLSGSNVGGALGNGHLNFGAAWYVTAASGNQGLLYQSAFEDAYGAPILQPNTNYSVRVWIQTTAPLSTYNVQFWLNSPSTSFTAKASIPGASLTTYGNYWTVPFTPPVGSTYSTPSPIPNDFQLEVFVQGSAGGATVMIDEISILYASEPFTDTALFGSYVNNPEALDGVTGKFGSSDDPNKIMDFGIIRQTMYFLTQEPSGKLHQTSDNGTTEPSGWNVFEVAANCGLLSAFALTKSQADDSSSSGGEEWMAWASASGPRIFGGDQAYKIGQEIQPNWSGDKKRGFNGINFAAALTSWVLNNPTWRVMLFGIPSLDSPASSDTAPNLILALNYRELETVFAIATSAPIHTSFSGRLIATDHTRKWTRWNMTMNGASLMHRSPADELEVVLWGGNGSYPGTIPSAFVEVNGVPVSYDNNILVNSAFVSGDGVIDVNGSPV